MTAHSSYTVQQNIFEKILVEIMYPTYLRFFWYFLRTNVSTNMSAQRSESLNIRNRGHFPSRTMYSTWKVVCQTFVQYIHMLYPGFFFYWQKKYILNQNDFLFFLEMSIIFSWWGKKFEDFLLCKIHPKHSLAFLSLFLDLSGWRKPALISLLTRPFC